MFIFGRALDLFNFSIGFGFVSGSNHTFLVYQRGCCRQVTPWLITRRQYCVTWLFVFVFAFCVCAPSDHYQA